MIPTASEIEEYELAHTSPFEVDDNIYLEDVDPPSTEEDYQMARLNFLFWSRIHTDYPTTLTAEVLSEQKDRLDRWELHHFYGEPLNER